LTASTIGVNRRLSRFWQSLKTRKNANLEALSLVKLNKPKQTQGDQIEQIPTADLIPYARNSRTHSDEQVAQIAASIREFGFCNPVLIDAQNTIIAGHGRVLAAGRMKLETVSCLRLTHLTDAQRRAYVIADNRIALSSGWDAELLANELSDLHADDFDMALLGFDAKELETLLGFEAGSVASSDPPESSSSEVDVDGFSMGAKCPRCSFEFNPDKA